ncbi:BYPASS-related protein [Tanacetum coccineum]
MPFGTFRRSIMGIGNDHNQVHSMDVNGGDSSTGYHFRDAFMACQVDFNVALSKNEVDLAKPPLDKFVTEFFDRSIRALDICNAIRDGIEKIRLWHKHLEIVSNALESKSRNVIVEGQFRRAKKALTDLAIVMLDDNKESASMFSHRNRSFGRPNKGKDHQKKPGHSRSLSWSVPNSWSACKQLQLIANGLIPPKSHEISATNGLANVVYTMGFVLMFVLWALVAAIPCQDRSLQVNFTVPRQFSWGTPLNLLHIRIMDESKKRERKNSAGLLKEIHQMEQSIHVIMDLVDSVNQFPLTEEQKEEVQTGVKEMSLVCDTFKNGLDPLERQLREVFRKIMSCRTEGLEILGRAQA